MAISKPQNIKGTLEFNVNLPTDDNLVKNLKSLDDEQKEDLLADILNEAPEDTTYVVINFQTFQIKYEKFVIDDPETREGKIYRRIKSSNKWALYNQIKADDIPYQDRIPLCYLKEILKPVPDTTIELNFPATKTIREHLLEERIKELERRLSQKSEALTNTEMVLDNCRSENESNKNWNHNLRSDLKILEKRNSTLQGKLFRQTGEMRRLHGKISSLENEASKPKEKREDGPFQITLTISQSQLLMYAGDEPEARKRILESHQNSDEPSRTVEWKGKPGSFLRLLM